jgi:hypothetical protein
MYAHADVKIRTGMYSKKIFHKKDKGYLGKVSGMGGEQNASFHLHLQLPLNSQLFCSCSLTYFEISESEQAEERIKWPLSIYYWSFLNLYRL